jgi:hypothetical protein
VNPQGKKGGRKDVVLPTSTHSAVPDLHHRVANNFVVGHLDHRGPAQGSPEMDGIATASPSRAMNAGAEASMNESSSGEGIVVQIR